MTESLTRSRAKGGDRPITVFLTGAQSVSPEEEVPEIPLEQVQWPLLNSAESTKSTLSEENSASAQDSNLKLKSDVEKEMKRLSFIQRVSAVFRRPWI